MGDRGMKWKIQSEKKKTENVLSGRISMNRESRKTKKKNASNTKVGSPSVSTPTINVNAYAVTGTQLIVTHRLMERF